VRYVPSLAAVLLLVTLVVGAPVVANDASLGISVAF
jgi:hypothetical protein